MTAPTTRFHMIRDVNGYNGFGILNSNQNVQTTLATGVEQHTNAPTDYAYYLAIFYYSNSNNVFVSNSGTPTIPTGSFASSNCVINPVAWGIKGGSTLSFITPDTTAYVTVAFYSLPEYGTASI